MATQKRMILLVEDNPDDEMLTLDALRQGGLQTEIVVARDGAAACDFLFAEEATGTGPRQNPHLVLLDLKLPKISGHEVLRRIRTNIRTQHVPVVILTSSNEPTDRETGYRNGVNSYLQKPVEFDRFLEVVRTLGVYWLVWNKLPPGHE